MKNPGSGPGLSNSTLRLKSGHNDHRTTDRGTHDCVHYSLKAVVEQERETSNLPHHVVIIHGNEPIYKSEIGLATQNAGDDHGFLACNPPSKVFPKALFFVVDR